MFSFIVIALLLINPIFNCTLFLLGISSASGQLQYAYIAIFALVFFAFSRNISYRNFLAMKSILIFVFVFAFLYLFTGIFYGENKLYKAEFLSWGAACLPAIICGSLCSIKSDFYKILNAIPYFIIPITIILTYIAFSAAGRSGADLLLDDTTGINYQSISYYMAQLFGLASLCILERKHRKEYFFSFLMYIMLMLELIVCLKSGGRGGLVLIVIYLAYFFKRTINGIHSISRKLIFLILCITVFLIVAYNLDIHESAGVQRMFQTFEEGDSSRNDLKMSALSYIYESPFLGYGLGSCFYLIGIYSHNIFLDIMLESGALGLLAFLFIMMLCIKQLMRMKKTDSHYSLIVLLFMYALTLNMFSGYWIANHILWFAMGYCLTSRSLR